MVKPTTDDVIKWAREAGATRDHPVHLPNLWTIDTEGFQHLVALAYAAGAADMKELAVNICESEASLEIPNASAAYQQGREIGATVCGVYIRALGEDE